MFGKEEYGSHEVHSNFGQARSLPLAPTPVVNEITYSQASRKRKRTDVEPGTDIGEAFTIEVCS